jgi:hypothetical protein
LTAKRILFFPAMVEVLADGLMHQDCAPSGAARFALDHIKETRQFESVSEIRINDTLRSSIAGGQNIFAC